MRQSFPRMVGEGDGIRWQGDRHNPSRNDLGSLRSIDNALSKHSGHHNRGFRVCIRHAVLASVGVEIFCRLRDIWRVHAHVYIVWRVRRSPFSPAFTDNNVVLVQCDFTCPSVDCVLCKNVEDPDDIVHCSLDFRPDFLEVSGGRFVLLCGRQSR